jgi:hypothetical protein
MRVFSRSDNEGRIWDIGFPFRARSRRLTGIVEVFLVFSEVFEIGFSKGQLSNWEIVHDFVFKAMLELVQVVFFLSEVGDEVLDRVGHIFSLGSELKKFPGQYSGGVMLVEDAGGVLDSERWVLESCKVETSWSCSGEEIFKGINVVDVGLGFMSFFLGVCGTEGPIKLIPASRLFFRHERDWFKEVFKGSSGRCSKMPCRSGNVIECASFLDHSRGRL